MLEPPRVLVYRSRRRTVNVSWSITLGEGPGPDRGTRVHLRLRLGPMRWVWLVKSVGGLFDLLTIAGMAAGLRERLTEQRGP